MMILMQPGAKQGQISSIISKAETLRLPVHISRKNGQTSIAIVLQGNEYLFDEFASLERVASASSIS